MTCTLYFINDEGYSLKEGLVDTAQRQSIDGLVKQIRTALVDVVNQPEFRHVKLVELPSRDPSAPPPSADSDSESDSSTTSALKPESSWCPHPLVFHKSVPSSFCAVLVNGKALSSGRASSESANAATVFTDSRKETVWNISEALSLQSVDVTATVDFYGLLVGQASLGRDLATFSTSFTNTLPGNSGVDGGNSTSHKALVVLSSSSSGSGSGSKNGQDTNGSKNMLQTSSLANASAEAESEAKAKTKAKTSPLAIISKETGALEILDPSLATRVDSIVQHARGARQGFQELYSLWGDVLSDALDSAVMIADEEDDDEEDDSDADDNDDDDDDDEPDTEDSKKHSKEKPKKSSNDTSSSALLRGEVASSDDDDGDEDEKGNGKPKSGKEDGSNDTDGGAIYMQPFDLIRLTTLRLVLHFDCLALPHERLFASLGGLVNDATSIARKATVELTVATLGGFRAAFGNAHRLFWNLEKKVVAAAPIVSQHAQVAVRFALAAVLLHRAALILEVSRDPFVRAARLRAEGREDEASKLLLIGEGEGKNGGMNMNMNMNMNGKNMDRDDDFERKKVEALQMLEKINDGLVSEDVFEEKLEVDKQVHARFIKQRVQLLSRYLDQMYELTGLQKYKEVKSLLESHEVRNHLFKRVNPGKGGHRVNKNCVEYLHAQRFGAMAVADMERDGVVFDPKTRRRLLRLHQVRPVELLKEDPRFKPYLDPETLQRLRSKPLPAELAEEREDPREDQPPVWRRRLHSVVHLPNDPLDNFAAAEGAVAKQFKSDMAQLDA
eukprot:CAMPEP_0175063056 /NCGR_PEP_ID=MMETSP0052_2-20121109/14528_1 /TAXON_ID=51329 ORGANISM="Polytomella parva, Strain SAG 63-3" /NCGR_SAMPLE_ID=MMETSP0052_2 /ASSEMBLY_ACC=CAM_ASM_000194 /LENGTH=783 /DNA_ID=CAMNT_0016329179 /DNA_START=32 /DNA_END=2379 /DNA_ORIENTATION=+